MKQLKAMMKRINQDAWKNTQNIHVWAATRPWRDMFSSSYIVIQYLKDRQMLHLVDFWTYFLPVGSCCRVFLNCSVAPAEYAATFFWKDFGKKYHCTNVPIRHLSAQSYGGPLPVNPRRSTSHLGASERLIKSLPRRWPEQEKQDADVAAEYHVIGPKWFTPESKFFDDDDDDDGDDDDDDDDGDDDCDDDDDDIQWVWYPHIGRIKAK